MFDYLIFVGRFQPAHIGHEQVIRTALANARKVIILIGSSFQPRTIKNPWTHTERTTMLFAGLSLSNKDRARVIVAPLQDQAYNDQKWASSVQSIVDDVLRKDHFPSPTVGIIGHVKDESSYYLKLFPQWKLVEHEMNEVVNATDIRKLLFEGKSLRYLSGLLSPGAFSFIEQFTTTSDFSLLQKEYEFIEKYKKSWSAAPYPVNLVTVDACVIQSGHVLLVKRGANPGLGLFALPGGYLNVNERVVDGMIRELREETKLKVPDPVLRGSIKASEVYDDPNRSLRGRVITHTFLIELPPGALPPVKGGDDAVKAFWWPLSFVFNNPELFFEDHQSMIIDLAGKL